MNPIIQRIADWLRERRLKRLERDMLAADAAGEHEFAVDLWHEFDEEHAKRSPQQVARMNRRESRAGRLIA